MFLFASALALGFLHGLGGDHLMAIAALSMENAADASAAARRLRAVSVALRFALGHAVLLGIGAALIVAFGWMIPPHVERGGELLGGALLIVMGVLTLQHLSRHVARRTGHSASSTQQSAPSAQHSALSTEHLPAMVGAAFAVSSLRALALLTPFGNDVQTEPLPLLLALIAVFASGIVLSMSLFGVLLAGILSTRALRRVGQGAGALVGLSSIALGIVWVATA